jgi:hypothetical protein
MQSKPITSPEINKVIRQRVSPILKANGFGETQTRNNWAYTGDAIWVLVIRAVGDHFSRVTGWPSMSIGVHLSVWVDCIPQEAGGPLKMGTSGRPMPLEYQCMFRNVLASSLDQSDRKSALRNPAERKRTDLWWVDPDGCNLVAVIDNIAAQIAGEALPWYRGLSDLDALYRKTLTDRDCYNKYLVATFLAKRLGLAAEYTKHNEELRAEAARIGETNILKLLQ